VIESKGINSFDDGRGERQFIAFVRLGGCEVRDLVITVGQNNINTKLFPGRPRRRPSTSSNDVIHQTCPMLIRSLSPTAMVAKCLNRLEIEIDRIH
jgi:hypothetical protein